MMGRRSLAPARHRAQQVFMNKTFKESGLLCLAVLAAGVMTLSPAREPTRDVAAAPVASQARSLFQCADGYLLVTVPEGALLLTVPVANEAGSPVQCVDEAFAIDGELISATEAVQHALESVVRESASAAPRATAHHPGRIVNMSGVGKQHGGIDD